MFGVPLILLFISCASASQRIIGGNSTNLADHLYFVSIEYMGLPRCGGSLITKNAVLTSASCVFGYRLDVLKARVGTDENLADITSTCHHPLFDFQAPSFDYDVTVLNLSRSYVVEEGALYVQLQPPNLDVPTGRLATIVGYGTKGWGGSINEGLMLLDMPRVRDIDCQLAFSQENITDRMVCFGDLSGEKDACNTGGSPLMYDGRQVGIDSWGYGCAREGVPRVFTRVYNEDIQLHIVKCRAGIA